jgi:serine/threonine protein kinase
MKYIHSQGFIHRDLKPGNILIDADGQALISDFGTACLEASDTTLTPEAGTVHYTAPEMFFEDPPCTNKVDVFSFGSVLYEILSEKAAFHPSLFALPVRKALVTGEMPPIPDVCGPVMQDLIRRCWSMKPEFRPSFDSILAEFAYANFDFVPGANAQQVRAYIEGIRSWESVSCS